jgi:hypothetical protein
LGAEQVPRILEKMLKKAVYSTKEVCNIDETSLFLWKRMYVRTYISKEE